MVIFGKLVNFWSFFFIGNATVCRQVTNPVSIRDVEWSTQTCLLNFNTIGIWPETMDGTDLSTCAKSPNGKLLATGDDFGKIKLYTYPVPQPKVSFVCELKKTEFYYINVSIFCSHSITP